MTTETPTAAASPAASTPATAPATAPAPASTTPATPATPASMMDAPAAPATPAAPAEAPQPPAEGTPEAYDLTPLEGTQFDEEMIGELKAFAKESNMPKEQAQKLAEMGQKSVQKYQARVAQQVEQQQQQWVSDSRTDKEFGGDKLSENLAVAKKARDAFGTPELTQLLNESGLGNHPEVIRFFFRAGQAIAEDRMVPGAARPNGGDRLAKMYPSMTQKA